MIRFYNTLGRRLEKFEALKNMQVGMYTCGPTVWNYPHIGKYRTFLFEDLLRRFLKYRGYKVTQVMNLTDVDDRIIKVCKEKSLDISEFTEKYAKSFFEDLEFLRIERAEFYPRATHHIPEMVKIIEGLLKNGFAYKSEEGSIYFSISKFPRYGMLSGLEIKELKAGARVRQDDYSKDSAQDFALWKAWDENDGNIFWETSLGKGRPGWHIECSAMSMKYLGEEFDIHTGGVDNIFPHHENEIAQSEAYTGKRFARYWLHSEHLLVNEAKMAKRLGNFITINELKNQGVDGETVRFLLLSGHYRAQLNFTEKSIEQAASSVKRITEFVRRLEDSKKIVAGKIGDNDGQVREYVKRTRFKYIEALENDLDAPTALAVVFEFISEGNRNLDQNMAGSDGIDSMLHFMHQDFDTVFAVVQRSLKKEDLAPVIAAMLKEREEARTSKDWAKSDSLRKKLLEIGIEVQDTPQGQKWRRKSAVPSQ